MSANVKILIVDDHDLMRLSLSHILSDVDGFDIVGEVDSGEVALKIAHKLAPDIILMDIEMPGIGGLEATRRLKAINQNHKIIAVTASVDEFYPNRLFKAGAVACVSKKTQPDEVVKAIRMVAAGQHYVSQEIAQKMALRNTRLNGNLKSPFESLSDRELQIAIMVVNGEKAPIIANKLNISSKTINSYRYRIFDKFDISNDVELVHLAIRHKIFSIDILDQ